MANETKRRANDKAAKKQFQKLLVNVFSVSNEKICITDRTTDVILKIGNDENDWLFFELKCTSDEVLCENKKYFGAISMNQWMTYKAHPHNYYFVIAIEDSKGIYRFTIISPTRIEKYLTGLYGHTDFSVPKDILNKTFDCAIENELRNIKDNNFADSLPDSQGKQDLIDKLHNKLSQ